MKHISASALLGALALIATDGSAHAHPHVFAEARLEVAVAPDGHVEALRHVWRFDELFSSTVLLEFDADTDNRLEEPELEEVASVVADSISEFGYFQTITANGKDVGVKPVDDMKVLFEDGQMIIFFTTVPSEQIAITSSPTFGIYDPTFYTAIDFYDDSNMVLEGAPENCSGEMVVPDPDEALAQNQATLTDAFFNDPAGTDFSKLLATRMEVTCK
jgi:ABC-type uncharacterized transport system substrate-binding protein